MTIKFKEVMEAIKGKEEKQISEIVLIQERNIDEHLRVAFIEEGKDELTLTLQPSISPKRVLEELLTIYKNADWNVNGEINPADNKQIILRFFIKSN